MRQIEGTRYISASEYAEIKGITKGRVSQLKATLPFETFDDFGIELINYDKLELEQDSRKLMDIRYSTRHPIHQYTYGELGKFFAKLLGEQTKAEEAAGEKALLAEELKDIALNDLFQADETVKALTTQLEAAREEAEKWEAQAQEQIAALEQLHIRYTQLEGQLAAAHQREVQQGKDREKLLTQLLAFQEERSQMVAQQAINTQQEDLRGEVEQLKKMVATMMKKTGKK